MPAANNAKLQTSKPASEAMMVRKLVMGSCFRTGLNTCVCVWAFVGWGVGREGGGDE
jgi:hypothetical protein